MHAKTILTSAVLVAGIFASGSAFAQSQATNSPSLLNGAGGTMTCSDFLQLGHTDQASIAGQIKMDAPKGSLTSNSGVGAPVNGTKADGGYKGSLGLGAPLTSGQLIAACQAASPSASLQDAYNGFVSGSINQQK